MWSQFILSWLMLLPLIGSFIVLLLPRDSVLSIKVVGLFFSVVTFLASIFLWVFFDKSSTYFQFAFSVDWLSAFNISFHFGVDGISLFFILLSTFLIPLCLLCSWSSIKHSIKEYVFCFLLLDALLVIVFSVLDLVLFYVFFEGILIPMFLVIGVWGSSSRRIYAAYMFFLYTLLGSILMLLAIIVIYLHTGTTNIELLLSTSFDFNYQIILWLAFFASFAIKVPMLPFHIWLPEAHVEAPTAGSVLLAGILLKLGGYGFLRISLPMFPDASVYFTPMVYTMSVLAIIYTSLTTLRQVDLKRVIAYSSVAHMNFVTLGMFTLNAQGIEGSILLMLSHGIVSSGLFLCIGVLYDRYKSRVIQYYSGLTQVMPIFATIFLIFTLGNISLPGTSSFVGELLVLVGAFQSSIFVTILATTGTVLGAAYSIWLYNRVCFGNLSVSYLHVFSDVSRREFYIFIPFLTLLLLMGVMPNIFLDPMHTSVSALIEHIKLK